MSRPAEKTESRPRASLRLEPELWRRIDRARAARPGNLSRNTWIAEAIIEKLKRDVANDKTGEGPDA